jgi:hypothetical protein
MLGPALQIEKQGADQSSNCADKEFAAKHTTYRVFGGTHPSHAGHGQGKNLLPWGEQPSVSDRYGRRQMKGDLTPHALRTLQSSIRKRLKRTEQNSPSSRRELCWAAAFKDSRQPSCRDRNLGDSLPMAVSELPSDRNHQSQPSNSSG